MSRILYGKPVAALIRDKTALRAEKLAVKPCLAAVGFAEPHWEQYASSLDKSASSYGASVRRVTLPDGAGPETFYGAVSELSEDKAVHGIIVQQPLPAKFGGFAGFIPACKDVDCLGSDGIASLFRGGTGFCPATPSAVLALLDYYGVDVLGKNAVIIGRGISVGKPLSLMLLGRSATVTVCHTKTRDLAAVARNADILISACGAGGLVTENFVNPSATVIDVGLSFANGKTSGDVDFDAVNGRCAALSPVPGGIGPVTRACLFENLVTAAEQFNGAVK